MKKILEGCGFRQAFFLLTAISFNSVLAGWKGLTAAAGIVLLWGSVLILYQMTRWQTWRKIPYHWGLLLFLASYALSSYMNRSYGLIENVKGLAWMALELLLLYGLGTGVSWKNRKREIHTLSLVVIVYTAVQAVLSLGLLMLSYEGISGAGKILGMANGRLWGLYTDPNYGSVLAVISLVASCGGCILSVVERKWKPLLWINVLLQYLYIVFSFSRTGYLCLIIASGCMLLYWCKTADCSWKKKLLAVVLAVAVLAVGGDLLRAGYNWYSSVTTVYAADTETVEEETQALERRENLDEDVSSGRFTIWKEGIMIWKTSPVYGISYRNISPYIVANFPDSYMAKQAFPSLNTFHNVVMDVLVSQGLIGLGLFILLAILMLQKGIRILVSLEGERLGYGVFLGIPVIIVMVAAMFVTDVLYLNTPTAILFWCCMGWLLRINKRR